MNLSIRLKFKKKKLQQKKWGDMSNNTPSLLKIVPKNGD
jgi:hypothetical protein